MGKRRLPEWSHASGCLKKQNKRRAVPSVSQLAASHDPQLIDEETEPPKPEGGCLRIFSFPCGTVSMTLLGRQLSWEVGGHLGDWWKPPSWESRLQLQ